ncbi:hypothetical protein Ancab_005645 [Ancistrocladus abbreviatus]
MVKFSHLLCLILIALAIVEGSARKANKEHEDEDHDDHHDHEGEPNGEEGDHHRHEEDKSSKEEVGIYELKTEKMHAKFTNWGATIISLYLPDRNGKMEDVVLGFDSIEDYKNDTAYFGATVGRVANRIGGAQFTLDGVQYKIVPNDGKNTLHGGPRGYGDVIWTVKKHRDYGKDPYITFAYDSFDGEEGFPGKLSVKTTFRLHTKHNSMAVKMTARAGKKATPVNLAQHAYWNLGGHNSGDILSHKIQILGSNITPVDNELIPTGEIKSVKGTPFDFLEPRAIGSQINQLPKAYDINYALDVDKSKDTKKHTLNKVVVLEDPKSGRKMELSTNQPGLQFYTSGMLKDVKGKRGVIYNKYAALCLETQGYPDSVNHKNFPSQILNPKEKYEHIMEFKFSTTNSS